MRRTLVLLLPLLTSPLTAPPLLGAAPAAVIVQDEIEALREKARTPQAPAALVRLVELALADGDVAAARDATAALADFGGDGDLALERVLRDAALPGARSRALEICVARRRPEDRGLFVELALRGTPVALRMQAIDALESDPEALPLLEPLLRCGDPAVESKSMRLFARARLPAAVARAREVLTPESRASVALKIAAIDALRAEGGRDSIRRLVEVAGAELGETRDFAFKSLLVMDRGAVLLLLLPMLTPDAPTSDALVALAVLARVEGAREIPELRAAVRAALDHRDSSVQAAAARTLAELGDREAIARLRRAMTSFDPLVAAAAVEALTVLDREDPGWREKLRRMLHAPQASLRLAAVRSLARLSDETVVAPLVQLLEDDDWRVREAAVESLGALRPAAAVEPMIARLEGERLRVRSALVSALRRTTGMPFRDNGNDWRRWWADVHESFVVPPLAQVEAMEARLARNAVQVSTRASFYGIPVDSDHLALVIDVSGSMGEIDGSLRGATTTEPTARVALASKLDVAKLEVEQLLDRLPDGAAVNLLFFGADVQCWSHSLVPLNRRGAARACAFLRDRRASGSTNLYEGLAQALSDPEVDTIYLLSDGQPTSGKIVDPAALRTEIRRRNAGRNVRVHVVALGIDMPLLHHLSEDSGGTFVAR